MESKMAKSQNNVNEAPVTEEVKTNIVSSWEVPAPFPANDLQVPAHVEGAITAPEALEAPVIEAITTPGKVTVIVPNQFDLTIDYNHTITVKPGIQEMEKAHADHWYAIANGVVIYKPEATE